MLLHSHPGQSSFDMFLYRSLLVNFKSSNSETRVQNFKRSQVNASPRGDELLPDLTGDGCWRNGFPAEKCLFWTDKQFSGFDKHFFEKRSVVVVMICEMPCGNCLGRRVELHDEELMGR